jgi:hypothetical protein
MTFGEVELKSNPAFQGVLELVAQIGSNKVRSEVIPQADHFYSGCRKQVAAAVTRWLVSL